MSYILCRVWIIAQLRITYLRFLPAPQFFITILYLYTGLKSWYSFPMFKTTFIKCSFCGAEVSKPLKEISRQNRKGNYTFYCGRNCYIYKVKANYSQTWQAFHKRARYYFIKCLCRPLTCARCNHYSPKNQIHHIDGNFKNNLPNNLECLCSNCHPLEDALMRIKRIKQAHNFMRLSIRQGVNHD